MTRTGEKIVKNASVLMISQLVTWGLTLLLTIFLPRYLGAAAVGDFAVATSIWAVMGVLIGFGMDTLLTKEIARHPYKVAEMLGTTFILRSAFYCLSCGIVATYMRIMAYPDTTVYIVYIIGISHLIWQFSSACQSILQGLETMQYISIATVASKAVNTILCIVLILLGYGIYAIGLVAIAASLVSFLLQLIFLKKQHQPHIRIRIVQIHEMLKASAPYLLSGLGMVIYAQVDVLIISSLVNRTEVGWYGAASQLFGTLLFIPVVFTMAIFPALTRTYASEPDSLPQVLRKSFNLMLVLSVPIGLGLTVVADQIVVLLFGPAFAPSGPILAVMGIVLILTYQNILLGQFLISTDRQNAWTRVMLAATAITIPLDLFLVPWCQQTFGNGALAGSITFVITETAMVAIGIWLLPKGSLGWSNIHQGAKILVIGLAMAGAAWPWRNDFIIVPVSIGAATYIALVALLRVLPAEDIALIHTLLRRLLKRAPQAQTDTIRITGA